MRCNDATKLLFWVVTVSFIPDRRKNVKKFSILVENNYFNLLRICLNYLMFSGIELIQLVTNG